MTTQAVADAEGAEAEFMYALEARAPASVRHELGMVAERLAGGVVLSMRHDPAGGYWNKALGFGISEPVTSELIDAGARVLSAETWAERPGQHNPSLHNLRRVGFVDQYERRNWVWRP